MVEPHAATAGPATTPQQPAPASADFGWRAHAAQEAWITRADTKASVLLALEGGLLVAAVADRTGDSAPPGAQPVNLATIVLLLLAIAVAAAAVLPMVGSTRNHRREYERNLLYFGYLRLWNHDQLAERMRHLTADDEAAMLARQLVVASRLNWWKHRCLQVSVALAMAGLVALTLAVVGES